MVRGAVSCAATAGDTGLYVVVLAGAHTRPCAIRSYGL